MTSTHETAHHRFRAPTTARGRPRTAEVLLSDMQGVPLPWSLFQGALEFMLQHWSLDTLFQAGCYEDAELVLPDTGLSTEEILAVSHRRQPADRTAGCLEARLAFPIRGGWSHDPEAPPVTRVQARILQGSAWHTEPDLQAPPRELARRIAQGYGIEAAHPREAPRKARAELEWDLEHGMTSAPALVPVRAMLQELLARLPAQPPL